MKMLTFSTLIALVIPSLAHAAEPASKPKPPNVLIVLADDLGYSDVGCYGGEIATPNLDRLAKNGLRFSQFYNTARCWPSRAALLTGYYAQQVRRDGVPGIRSGVAGSRPEWAKLLPELLQPLGYRSYLSGKWHVDGSPLKNGFDRSYVLDDHDRNFSPRRHLEDDKILPADAVGHGHYSTTYIADHAIRCLKDHAKNHADKPFFEFLAFTVPHFPLQAPPEDIARYQKTYASGWDDSRDQRWKKLKELGLGGKELSTVERDLGPPYVFAKVLEKISTDEVNRPTEWKSLTQDQKKFQSEKMAVHAAMVDRMDREIGRVLEQIHAMGAEHDTLVFFLSDNGASAEMMVRGDGHDPKAAPGSAGSYLCLGPGWSSMANTPFRRHKSWVHEGGISTPLIVHWPKGIAARGEIRHTPGHIIDLVPTVLEAAGTKRPDTMNGKPVPPPPGHSIVPLFAKDGAVKHETIWWQHEGNRALLAGKLKIVAAGNNADWELYDFTDGDRSESKNLARDKPDTVRELDSKWTKLRDQFLEQASRDLPPAAKIPTKKADE